MPPNEKLIIGDSTAGLLRALRPNSVIRPSDKKALICPNMRAWEATTSRIHVLRCHSEHSRKAAPSHQIVILCFFNLPLENLQKGSHSFCHHPHAIQISRPIIEHSLHRVTRTRTLLPVCSFLLSLSPSLTSPSNLVAPLLRFN